MLENIVGAAYKFKLPKGESSKDYIAEYIFVLDYNTWLLYRYNDKIEIKIDGDIDYWAKDQWTKL